MAIQGQPPVQGGLSAMAPPKAAPAAQPPAPSEAKDAARISGMEQATPDTPENYMAKAIDEQRKVAAALKQQTALLAESYGRRTEMPFDTSLMAAASGFLKPTKTGSFGESAGYAAEAYAADADKAALRKQQAAKAQLELAQQQQAMGTKNLEFEHMLQMAGYDPKNATTLTGGAGSAPAPAIAPSGAAGEAPTAGAPPSAAPVAGAAPVARPPASSVGQTGATNELPMISDRDITTAYAISKEHGDKIAAIAKMQREDLVVNEGNVFSKSQKKFLDVTPPNEKASEFDFGPAGPRKTTPDVFREYQKIIKTGTDEDLTNFYIKNRWLAGKPSGGTASGTTPAGTPPAGGAPAGGGLGLPTKFKSEEEKRQEAIDDAATKEARVALEAARAKTGEERASTLINRGEGAPTLRAISKDMDAYATSNPRIFDLLQGPGIGDRFAKFVEAGLQAGQFGSFSLPVTILAQNKKLGITTEDLQALQMFAQASAKLTTEMRRASRVPGEGATSESEGKLYATVEALPSDSAKVIRLKTELLGLRTDFDERAAQLWVDWRDQNKGKSFDNFRLHSPEFKELRNNYDKALDARREANAEYFSGKKTQATPQVKRDDATKLDATGNPATPSAGKPNERVIGGFIWERQPDGGWNNTGRKAK